LAAASSSAPQVHLIYTPPGTPPTSPPQHKRKSIDDLRPATIMPMPLGPPPPGHSRAGSVVSESQSVPLVKPPPMARVPGATVAASEPPSWKTSAAGLPYKACPATREQQERPVVTAAAAAAPASYVSEFDQLCCPPPKAQEVQESPWTRFEGTFAHTGQQASRSLLDFNDPPIQMAKHLDAAEDRLFQCHRSRSHSLYGWLLILRAWILQGTQSRIIRGTRSVRVSQELQERHTRSKALRGTKNARWCLGCLARLTVCKSPT